jgi:hypothetical protein
MVGVNRFNRAGRRLPHAKSHRNMQRCGEHRSTESMTTLKEFLQKRQDLDQQIAAEKESGFAVAVTDIRRLISHFGITATDLEIAPRVENLKTKRPVIAAKYRDPE